MFKVENGILTLDREEVRAIPEFKVVLERDKGSEGDSDGRKKYRAFKEFLYIYYTQDLRSWVNKAGLSSSELHLRAVNESGLPKDFKVDKIIRAACDKYKEIHMETLPTLNLINTLHRGIRLTEKVAKTLVTGIEEYSEQMFKKQSESLEKGEPIDLLVQLKEQQILTQQLEELNKMANKVPDTIKTLEKLMKQHIEELSGSNLLRGGHTKGNRADPKKKSYE